MRRKAAVSQHDLSNKQTPELSGALSVVGLFLKEMHCPQKRAEMWTDWRTSSWHEGPASPLTTERPETSQDVSGDCVGRRNQSKGGVGARLSLPSWASEESEELGLRGGLACIFMWVCVTPYS